MPTIPGNSDPAHSRLNNSVVQPPTKEIIALCDDADALIERYLACVGPIRGSIRRFEAETEAYTIMKLLIRHLESVCELARHDLVLIPSAVVVARAAFEASVRARLMLRPVDPYEREVRWVMHLRTAIEHCSKLENRALTEVAAAYAARRQQFEKFDKDISRLLSERGYSIPKQAPKIWEMIKDIGEPNLYQFYILLSAYTHTNFEAGTLYRQNLGNSKILGEFITAKDWRLPLEVTWKSFWVTAHDFLYWVEADMTRFSAHSLLHDFETHLSQLCVT
jgi:hypothetical protein